MLVGARKRGNDLILGQSLWRTGQERVGVRHRQEHTLSKDAAPGDERTMRTGRTSRIPPTQAAEPGDLDSQGGMTQTLGQEGVPEFVNQHEQNER